MGETRRIGSVVVASLLCLSLAACSGRPAGPRGDSGGPGGSAGAAATVPIAKAGGKTRWPYELAGVPFLNEFRRYPDGSAEHSICGIYSWSRDASGSVERVSGPWPSFESERRDGIARGRFLFPFGTFYEAPDETRVSLPPLLFWISREISGETSGREADFMLFPLVLAGSSDRRGAYFTVPFGGTLKGKLGKEHITHVLFPLFARTKESAYTAYHAIFPLFAAWKGEEQRGFRVLPLYACDHKKDRFSRHYVLWPLFRFQREGLDTRAPTTIVSLLPLFDVAMSANHNRVSVLWPFFQHAWRLNDGFRETHAPWPFFSVTSGKEISGIKFWPFYCRRDGATAKSKFVMWPFYRRQKIVSGNVEELRQYFCFVSYRIERTEKPAGAAGAGAIGTGAGAGAETGARGESEEKTAAADDRDRAPEGSQGNAAGPGPDVPLTGANVSVPDGNGPGPGATGPGSDANGRGLRANGDGRRSDVAARESGGAGVGGGRNGRSGTGGVRREIIWKIWPFFRWKGDSDGHSEFKCLAPFWMEGGEDAVESGLGRLWNIYWRRRLPDGSETSRAFLRLYESRKSASGEVRRRAPLLFEYFGRRRPGNAAALDRDLSVGGGLLWRYRSVEGERVCGNFLFDYRRVSDGTERSKRFRILYGLFGLQTGTDAHVRILFVPFDKKGLRIGRGDRDWGSPGGPGGGDMDLPPPPVPVTIGHLDGPDGGRFVRGPEGGGGKASAVPPVEAAAHGSPETVRTCDGPGGADAAHRKAAVSARHLDDRTDRAEDR